MNADISEPRRWSRQRWWFLVAIVLITHIGFIFAFGDRKPLATRRPTPSTQLRLASPADELIALNDPTLFALPHRRSFAQSAWLKIPEISSPSYRWSEPPRLLALPVEQLGESFARFMQTNTFSEFVFQTKPAPMPMVAKLPGSAALAATNSNVRTSRELVNRRWLNQPALRVWPAADLLTNSVAQIVVRNDGAVFSAKILPPGSGSIEADQFALDAAQSARFTPERANDDRLTVGALVFEWVTVPLPATNAPNPTP
jgi:hypothetical protein